MKQTKILIIFVTLVTSSTILLNCLPGVVQADIQHWQKLNPDWKKSNISTRGTCIYGDDLYIGTNNNNFSRDLGLSPGFTQGTHITMSDGTVKNIEQIRIGDRVKVYNFETQQYTVAAVTSWTMSSPSNTPSSTICINNMISASPSQLFFVDDALKTAEKLTVGDRLINAQGQPVLVLSTSKVVTAGYFYSIIVGSSDLSHLQQYGFFAEGIQVYPWIGTGENIEDYIVNIDRLYELCGHLPGEIFATTVMNWMINIGAIYSDGGELWRFNYPEQTWTQLIGDHGMISSGFGSTTNWVLSAITVFNNKLYVGTWASKWPQHGCEIWQFDGSQWQKVISNELGIVSNGFGNEYNVGIMKMWVFTNISGATHLYAGTLNFNVMGNGCTQIWRTSDGTHWHKVVDRGFRDEQTAETIKHGYTWIMCTYNGKLYAGTFCLPVLSSPEGCQLYWTSTGNLGDWNLLPINGFDSGAGEPDNYGIRTMVNWNDQYLYIGITANAFKPSASAEALEIWRYAGSTNWLCVAGDDATSYPYAHNYDGFGNVYNKYPWSMIKCGGDLWVGTLNIRVANPISQGCEVWKWNTTSWTEVVGGPEAQNGFGNWTNWGARSMIEFPAGSGRIIVGTFRPFADKACEVWWRNP